MAELSKEMLLRAKTPFEVLRSEFDGHGYDIVVEAKGVLRHIQFKHSRADSKVRRQKVNVALTQKPGGCVIWSMVDRSTMGVGPFFWLGGKPGQALSNIGNKVARHTKGDQTGHKAPREAIRIVNQGQFQRIESMAALAICLFGDIYGPMANISEKEKDFWLSLPPPERRWAQKTYFPVGIPSSQTTPNMCIERRDGLLTSHFWFADGTLVRQSEPETAIDFPMIRDGWYDLGGGYLGENPPASAAGSLPSVPLAFSDDVEPRSAPA